LNSAKSYSQKPDEAEHEQENHFRRGDLHFYFDRHVFSLSQKLSTSAGQNYIHL
jgi:hypothetical protein